MSAKLDQLYAAVKTVNNKTPRKRVRNLLSRLMQAQLRRSKYDPHLAAVIYYLSLGTPPRSLWDND